MEDPGSTEARVAHRVVATTLCFTLISPAPATAWAQAAHKGQAGGSTTGAGAGNEPTGTEAAAAPADDDPVVAEARREFLEGAELVAMANWAEALGAFERSAAIRPHPVTTFNIAVCQRALGQHTRARLSFRAALDEHERTGGSLLSDTLVAQAKSFSEELDRLIVKVNVRLVPLGARIAVDGRPLAPVAWPNKPGLLVAGVRTPGRGEPARSERFEVWVDPGARVFAVTHPGFGDVTLNRAFAPGTTQPLDLELAKLPAEMLIEADRPGAVVRVDEIDVGIAPVRIERPGGAYTVLVQKPGYVTYETSVSLRPGDKTKLTAKLPEVEPALTDQWWFWAAAGAVVVGATVTTYALTRPDPERPPPNGGSLGWVVDVR
jgi:hypothetical protein